MNDTNVYLIRFNNNNLLSKAIVLAESFNEASKFLKEDYKEYGMEIQIEEYEELKGKGVTLTWHESIKE